jgi:transposase
MTKIITKPVMNKIATVGLDLAKNSFSLHAFDQAGNTVLTKDLKRGQVLSFFEKLEPCRVGLEACASAHYWARELIKLGHDVKLIPDLR